MWKIEKQLIYFKGAKRSSPDLQSWIQMKLTLSVSMEVYEMMASAIMQVVVTPLLFSYGIYFKYIENNLGGI